MQGVLSAVFFMLPGLAIAAATYLVTPSVATPLLLLSNTFYLVGAAAATGHGRWLSLLLDRGPTHALVVLLSAVVTAMAVLLPIEVLSGTLGMAVTLGGIGLIWLLAAQLWPTWGLAVGASEVERARHGVSAVLRQSNTYSAGPVGALTATLLLLVLLLIPLFLGSAELADSLPPYTRPLYIMLIAPVGNFWLLQLTMQAAPANASIAIGSGLQQRRQRQLVEAIRERDTIQAYELLDRGVDPNVIGDEAMTAPLVAAIENDDPGLVKALLRSGADPNACHALIASIRTAGASAKTITQLLIESGADVSVADSSGNTPLHAAAFRGDVAAIQLLLLADGDLESVNGQRQTPLGAAVSQRRWKAAQYLLDKGAKAKPRGADLPLFIAASISEDDPAGVELLLRHGADPNDAPRLGRTCLMAAALQGNCAICETLLKHGADVNAQDKFGSTALMEAARAGANLVLQRLVFWKPETEHRDKLGRTALLIAAGSKRATADTLKLLLAMGADPKAVSADGKDAITLCEAANRHGLLEALGQRAPTERRELDFPGAKAPSRPTAETPAGASEGPQVIDFPMPTEGELESPAADVPADTPVAAAEEPTASVSSDTAAATAAENDEAKEPTQEIDEPTQEAEDDAAEASADQAPDSPAIEQPDASEDEQPAAAVDEAPVDPTDDIGIFAAGLVAAAGEGDRDLCEQILDDHDALPEWVLKSAFNAAITQQHQAVAILLLEHGLPVTTTTDENRSLLLDLVSRQPLQAEVVLALIQRGADVDEHDDDGCVLTWLCRSVNDASLPGDHVRVVKALIKAGAAVDQPDAKGLTALHWAIRRCEPGAIKALVEAGASVQQKDDAGDTPLVAICRSEREDKQGIARLLLRHGADAGQAGGDGESPVSIAMSRGETTLAKLLSVKRSGKSAAPPRSRPQAVPDASPPKGDALGAHAERGELAAVRAACNGDADLNATDEHGCTPLIRAAGAGQIEVVQLLVEHGADLHRATPSGFTALFAAASAGHADVVRYLADQGADIEHRQEFGVTPLMLAAARWNLDVVKALLDLGADVNARDDSDSTALMAAVQAALSESASDEDASAVIDALLEGGANVSAVNDDGQSALMLLLGVRAPGGLKASGRRLARLVHQLLRAGAGVDQQDLTGWSALHAAAAHGLVEPARELMVAGANRRLRDINGLSACDLAMDCGHNDMVDLLIDRR